MKFLIILYGLHHVQSQFNNDRFIHPFERNGRDSNGVVLKSADKRKGPQLECGSDKITIQFDIDELAAMKLKVKGPEKIYFLNNEHCYSVREGNVFKLSIFFPFTGCGTNVVHDTEDYVYTNQIMLEQTKNRKLTLLQFRCVYEDKYIVSYEEGIMPVKRTLQFNTQMGEFDVDMKIFDGPEYQDSQQLSERTGVFLNERVYVSLDMIDPLKQDNIVMSIQTCYATDSPDYSQMGLFHYMISSMCAHPGDETINIIENGVSDEARFSFQMFRFTDAFSYIYIHCEVKVCNTTAEQCVGNQKLCNGLEESRGRRSALPTYDETQKIISRGPLLAYVQENAGEGEYTVNSIFLEDQTAFGSFRIPKLYIFGTVASGLVFGVVVGLTLIICKHKKQADARASEFKTFEQIQQIRSIYGDLFVGCKPATMRGCRPTSLPSDGVKPKCMPGSFL